MEGDSKWIDEGRRRKKGRERMTRLGKKIFASLCLLLRACMCASPFDRSAMDYCKFRWEKKEKIIDYRKWEGQKDGDK